MRLTDFRQVKPVKVRTIGAVASVVVCALGAAVPASAQMMSSGITEAINDLSLSLPVAGRIEGLAVREGDRVTKGTEILHLDNRVEELELKRRKLALDDRSALNAAVRREKTLKDQWQSLRRLVETNTVARKQADEEELAYLAAMADRQALEVGEEREKIDVDLARELLARRSLVAPVDGVIVKIVRQVGESVDANQPVVQLVNTGRVRFVGNVDVAWGAQLKVGSPVGISVGPDAAPLIRQGVVTFVSPVVDRASGLMEVKAEFDNADGSVRPGLAGRFRLGEGG